MNQTHPVKLSGETERAPGPFLSSAVFSLHFCPEVMEETLHPYHKYSLWLKLTSADFCNVQPKVLTFSEVKLGLQVDVQGDASHRNLEKNC